MTFGHQSGYIVNLARLKSIVNKVAGNDGDDWKQEKNERKLNFH